MEQHQSLSERLVDYDEHTLQRILTEHFSHPFESRSDRFEKGTHLFEPEHDPGSAQRAYETTGALVAVVTNEPSATRDAVLAYAAGVLEHGSNAHDLREAVNETFSALRVLMWTKDTYTSREQDTVYEAIRTAHGATGSKRGELLAEAGQMRPVDRERIFEAANQSIATEDTFYAIQSLLSAELPQDALNMIEHARQRENPFNIPDTQYHEHLELTHRFVDHVVKYG